MVFMLCLYQSSLFVRPSVTSECVVLRGGHAWRLSGFLVSLFLLCDIYLLKSCNNKNEYVSSLQTLCSMSDQGIKRSMKAWLLRNTEDVLTVTSL
jgi:hypothetical protein